MTSRDPNKKETWFWSDPHFFHANVIKYANRPFADVDEMNSVMLNNLNNLVLPNDELYILGDFIFGTSGKAKDILRRINCKNMHFIFGNHDKEMRKEEIKPFFRSMEEYKQISIHDPENNSHQKICLFHFPILEWDQAHRGAWMLHGHTHGNLTYPEMLSNHKITDVGVDCWDYKPVSFSELKKLFKDRQNVVHHGD